MSLLKFKELIHVLLVFIWKTMLFLLLSLNHSLIWDLRKAWNKKFWCNRLYFSSIVTKISIYLNNNQIYWVLMLMIGQGPQDLFWVLWGQKSFQTIIRILFAFSFSFSQTFTVELSRGYFMSDTTTDWRQKLTDYSFY